MPRSMSSVDLARHLLHLLDVGRRNLEALLGHVGDRGLHDLAPLAVARVDLLDARRGDFDLFRVDAPRFDEGCQRGHVGRQLLVGLGHLRRLRFHHRAPDDEVDF